MKILSYACKTWGKDPIWYFSYLCRKFSELFFWALHKESKSEIHQKMPILERRCYFLPFHSIFFPIFPKIEEWKEIAILKVLFPSTFILILEITISFHFDCYFLPFCRIAISFHFFWSINQSVNQQIYDLYIYKTSLFLITIQAYMQKG